jgi:protein-tyrosine-phosphatase
VEDRSTTPPLSVLFVCTANICRSAFAEQMARQLLGDDASVLVSSAGTHGWVDHSVDEPMAEELRTRGVEPDGFASRPLTMRMVDQSDLVLTAGMAHRQFILDDRPEAVWRLFTLGQFVRILQDVPADLHGRELLAACRRAHKPAVTEDDVPDPFGQGPEAADRAAARIEGLLTQILPRLGA